MRLNYFRRLKLQTENRKCRIQLNSAGYSDREQWYTIWQQAAAIERLCVEHGNPGVAYGLGGWFDLIPLLHRLRTPINRYLCQV